MSLDLDIGEFEINLTYNYGPMWHKAMDEIDRPSAWETCMGGKMLPLEGLTGAQSRPILERIITAMEADMPGFRSLNPENGWGNADLFLERLVQMLTAAIVHSTEVWRAFR